MSRRNCRRFFGPHPNRPVAMQLPVFGHGYVDGQAVLAEGLERAVDVPRQTAPQPVIELLPPGPLSAAGEKELVLERVEEALGAGVVGAGSLSGHGVRDAARRAPHQPRPRAVHLPVCATTFPRGSSRA